MLTPLEILKKYWNYSLFRSKQEEIIQSVLEGTDTLALLPTGGGKSICFQVPALCMDGICIVVSPLIALMKDQVENLQKRKIKAAAVYSGMTQRELDITLDNCVYGGYKFLYVSPERLKTNLFIERCKRMTINLLAIDEAHCISQWGYDFRPSYLEIAAFKEALNLQLTIALTATATKEVKEDIIDKLQLKSVSVFQKSFARDNLSYSVFKLENKESKLLEILRNVSGTSIVYARSRKKTEKIAHFLIRNRIAASFYHAGLSGTMRAERQLAWFQNRVRVMVATNAFGMGIDKPDVRTVIHMDLSDTLESYYQEAGRAGRDEKKAYAVILYFDEDIIQLKARLNELHVSIEKIRQVYRALANYCKIALGSASQQVFPFDFESFIKTYHLPSKDTYYSMKKLAEEGIIIINDTLFDPSRLHLIVNKTELYKFQVAHSKLDPLIKTILRLYGGEAFTDFVTIREHDIAKLLKISKQDVIHMLNSLKKLAIIDYVPINETASIIFNESRVPVDELSLDINKMKWIKKRSIQKAKSIINYLKTPQCRTRIFQHYFNEESNQNCNICDNDLKNKKNQTLDPFKILKLLIKPMTVKDVKKLLTKYPENQIIDSLRILVEDDLIKSKGDLFWKKN